MIKKEPVEEKQQFKCTICNKNFSKMDYVTEHISLVHGSTPFRCPICDIGFSRKTLLSTHISIEHSGRISENVDSIEKEKSFIEGIPLFLSLTMWFFMLISIS